MQSIEMESWNAWNQRQIWLKFVIRIANLMTVLIVNFWALCLHEMYTIVSNKYVCFCIFIYYFFLSLISFHYQCTNLNVFEFIQLFSYALTQLNHRLWIVFIWGQSVTLSEQRLISEACFGQNDKSPFQANLSRYTLLNPNFSGGVNQCQTSTNNLDMVNITHFPQ